MNVPSTEINDESGPHNIEHWTSFNSYVLLYNLEKDKAESFDVSMDYPEKVQQMKIALEEWRKSCTRSADGLDYVHN